MACSSGCPTQDHESWGACLRAKRLQVAPVEAHAYNARKNKSLEGYRQAREAGLQPEGVFPSQVADAWRKTEETGQPYRADQAGPVLL